MNILKNRILFIWELGGSSILIFLSRLLDEVKNRSLMWDVQIADGKMQGSLSNTASYVEVCSQAVLNDQIFTKFRSCKSYRKILEHVSPRTGEKYLRMLNQDGVPFKTLTSLSTRLNLGGPAAYRFKILGRISPTSIRYAKVHEDLRNLFGSLENYSVVEIGCGYGGLAVQLAYGEQLEYFAIADLEPVEKLAMKYIGGVLPEKKSLIRRASAVDVDQIDLVISNYAFSELTRDLQDEYLEKFILRSKRGYMIYNHINPSEFKSYSARDICEKIPGAQLKQEIPLTDETNVLIVWGDHLEER